MVGSKADELRKLRETVRKMLKENGAPPSDGKWADIAVLEPVRDYKARHASTLLTFDAVVDAIGTDRRQAPAGGELGRAAKATVSRRAGASRPSATLASGAATGAGTAQLAASCGRLRATPALPMRIDGGRVVAGGLDRERTAAGVGEGLAAARAGTRPLGDRSISRGLPFGLRRHDLAAAPILPRQRNLDRR